MLDMGLIRELVESNPQDLNSAIRVFDAGMADAVSVAPAYADNARQEIIQGSFGIACDEVEGALARQALNLRVQAALAQPAGNQPAPASNQPAPAGNQPAPAGNNRRGIPWWLWISLAVAIAAILVGGTARVLRNAGWGPQTQQDPGIPALNPTPAAAPAAPDAPAQPAAPAAGLTNPVLTLGDLSPLVLTRRTEFVASNDPQASQPNKVVCDALFSESGSQITVSGGLWADADGSIELSQDNGSSWTRVAEFSKRIKLPQGSYRLRVGDDGGRSAISFQEAP